VIGAVILASFAVLWVGAGVRDFGRRWVALLLTISVLISAAVIVTAIRIPFGKHSAGFNGTP
jgi:hypothetical protein